MAFWEPTQIALQSGDNPLVTKPKLTETLLQRPPFRFLHDVISAVQATTGFAENLFQGEETNAKAIKDKEQKLAYLQKIIKVIELCLGEQCPAKPSRIIAGQEAESTNILLQMLARAALQGNGAQAVQEVITNGVRRKSSSGDGASSQQQLRQRVEETQQSEPQPAPQAPQKEPDLQQSAPPPDLQQAPAKPEPHQETDPPKPVEQKASKPSQQQPSQSKSQYAKQDSVAQKSLARQNSKSKPATSRKAPPKPQDQSKANKMQTDKSDAPSISKQGKGVSVLKEGDDANDDEDIEIVVQQTVQLQQQLQTSSQQGALVKDILQAEEGYQQQESERRPSDDEPQSQGIILKRAGKKKEDSQKAANLDETKQLVQTLCQSCGNLAKAVEQFQEDVSTMSKEHDVWKHEKQVYESKLQQTTLDSDNFELAQKVRLLDQTILQAQERITSHRTQIIQAEKTIDRLIQMVVS